MLSPSWTTQRIPFRFPRSADQNTPTKSVRCGRRAPFGHASARGLLDLPAEIRLLIYEAIFTPASVVLQSGDNPAMIAVLRNFPELISRGSRDVQLFRTCRTCHDEAIPVFYGSLNLLVYQQLPLLRFSFLPIIGPINASFIKRVTITPIGLPGEHQRLLECLGSRHGGLVGLEHLTLEIWDLEQVAPLVSTCQELMQHHDKLKMLFGRGVDAEGQLQAGDFPARLKLAKRGQMPGNRVSLPQMCLLSAGLILLQERIMESVPVVDSLEPLGRLQEDCSREGSPSSRGRRRVSLAVPEPKRTIWSLYKTRRSRKS